MSATPKGYPTQKKDDLVVGAQFSTVQPLDQDKYGLDVHASIYVREVGTDAVEAGSTKIAINATAHAAKVGDIIRMTSGATIDQRVRVIKIEANIIHITELSVAPSAADTFAIMRHTAPLVDSDGAVEVNATLTQAPIRFKKDGVDVEVNEDTITPANNVALPVKLTSTTGDINITAGDLNVHLSHAGVNYDSTRIGDGTNLLSITASGEAEVSLMTALPAGTNNIGDVDVVSSVLPTGASTEAKQDTANSLLTTIDVDTGNIATNSAAINNKLPVNLGQKTMANSLAVVLASDQSVIDVDVTSTVLPPDAATETTLNNVNNNIASIASTVGGSELQVDVVAPLPAGTNNIGDVDVLTLPSIPTGSNTIGKVDVNTLDVVDFIDTNPVLDASVTTINGSAGAFVTIVASLAAAVKKLQILDTTGAFIGIYTGPASSEVLKVIIGPGSDQTIEASIPAGTRVSVRRLDSTTSITSGNLAINFLG